MRVQEFSNNSWQNLTVAANGTVLLPGSSKIRFASTIAQNITVGLTACTQSTLEADQQTCNHAATHLSILFTNPTTTTSTTTTTTTSTTTTSTQGPSTQYCGVDCSLFTCEEARAQRLCECEKSNPRNPVRHRPETNAIPGCGFAPNCISGDYTQFQGCV